MPGLSASPRNRRKHAVTCLIGALSLAVSVSTAWAQGSDAAGSTADDPRRPSRPVTSSASAPFPHWTVSVETIVLGRAGSGRQPLVSLVPGSVPWWTPTGPNTTNVAGVEALNSSQLGQRLAVGPRFGLTYRDDSGLGVELSYFNVLGLKAATSTGPNGQWLVMKAPGTFWQTQDYNYQAMVWEDDTRLHSAEALARFDVSPRITVSAGLRWLQLRDQLTGTLSQADLGQPLWKVNTPGATLSDAIPAAGSAIVVNPPFWTTSTTNNLYGIQLGAKAGLWELGRLSLDGVLKAGLYANRASQTTLVSMAKQIFPASATATAAALVTEGGLVAKYRLTDSVTLKLGYDALWLSSIALAPNQIQKTATTPSSVRATGVDSRGDTLFQGLTFGLEHAF